MHLRCASETADLVVVYVVRVATPDLLMRDEVARLSVAQPVRNVNQPVRGGLIENPGSLCARSRQQALLDRRVSYQRRQLEVEAVTGDSSARGTEALPSRGDGSNVQSEHPSLVQMGYRSNAVQFQALRSDCSLKTTTALSFSIMIFHGTRPHYQ